MFLKQSLKYKRLELKTYSQEPNCAGEGGVNSFLDFFHTCHGTILCFLTNVISDFRTISLGPAGVRYRQV